MKHTEGKLKVSDYVIYSEQREVVADTRYGIEPNARHDAERLCACWNALSMLETEQIASGAVERLVNTVKATMRDANGGEMEFSLWENLCAALAPFEKQGGGKK